ncbi:DUF5685 family protein [Clostridium chauvoei]|uniref:Uncharacterized protein n=2 Tax=Clostridium chauvoei TaxID=46867 RepID=S6EXX2_9CLOT|nr:DUF5685 family protein [Clostridium chauvoei]ATD54487.1 hypothetical protein BTM20_04250 [Clostridium chauvoei]ATD57830.1 hypothetical protein BTM21_08810 [Clostridium chauvoei]MBX7281644.1 hypothetical protein [Clostridium chauvoei]MBX7284164.1 hypothetical protein [Clostridium chauvoei]MBX7286692.1 hypothetical protein [Clostridium chauvoei]
MFGYITPLKGDLKVKDFDLFKSYYCGLCFAIKNNFGNIPRMTLNYDMTFLGVLLDSLSPDEIELDITKCISHPTQKRYIIINNKALSYASSINLSLFYYKLLDDVKDDQNLKSKFLSKSLYLYTKKIDKSLYQINNIINSRLTELNDFESKKSFSSIDEISHPFSDIVANILKSYPNVLIDDGEILRNNLYNFGYALGKWIYIIDALDDLKEDMENKKFNPINFLYNKNNLNFYELLENIKAKIEFTILNCSYNCKEYLSKLPLNKNKDILYNIIELGMLNKYITIINNHGQN